jgi:hypothetical protein
LKTIIRSCLILALLVGAGCGRKQSVDRSQISLPSWPRQFFQPTNAKALVWYEIYGHFPDTIEISSSKYWCAGVPAGVEITNHTRPSQDEIANGFLTRPFFVAALKRDLPQLVGTIESAPECTTIRGEIPDSPNLDYLRDVIGLVTWFFDNGAVAVLDPQTAVWYDREKWRQHLFDSNGLDPSQHVVVFYTEDKGGADTNAFWLHTRGMRKFARPDLSIHAVPADKRNEAIDLVNQLAAAEAFGGVIAEGQIIKTAAWPQGLTCHGAGSLDDPEFNNTHIEIGRPR